jgi:hypothetical protein
MAFSLKKSENPWEHALQGHDDTTMETAAQAYQAWFRSMMAMNSEATKFFTRRLQQDAQLPMTIVQCRSPQDVVQKQMEFLKTMANDYSGQAEKMGEIMSEGFHAIDRPATLSWPVPEKAQIVKTRDAA